MKHKGKLRRRDSSLARSRIRFGAGLFFAIFASCAGSGYAYSAPRCQESLSDLFQKTPTLRETFSQVIPSKNASDLVRRFVAAEQKQTSISNELFELVLKKVSPADVALWAGDEPTRFDWFYSKIAKQIDPIKLAQEAQSNPSAFTLSIISDERPWIQFLEPTTLDTLIHKLGRIAQESKSPRIGISLSTQWDSILKHSRLAPSVDSIIQPMLELPTFLKNMAFYEKFSSITRRRIRNQWGYSPGASSSITAEISLFQLTPDFEKWVVSCGRCPDLPETFQTSLLLKKYDIKSKAGVLVKAGSDVLGMIKNSGDRSFLAFRNVRDSQGRIVLVKGGVYAPHRLMAPDRHMSVVQLNSLPTAARQFYPMTYMLDQGNVRYTRAQFRAFLKSLDEVQQQWKSSVPPSRPKLPKYLTEWEKATDRTQYLSHLGSRELGLLLLKRWDEVPEKERILMRLKSKDYSRVLIEKWDEIAHPEAHLLKLEEEEFVEVLLARWEGVKNGEQYFEKISEYDLGKILVRHWNSISSPESVLMKIRDAEIRERVLRLRKSRHEWLGDAGERL